jgi:7-cyano-7-deazaguanine synthase
MEALLFSGGTDSISLAYWKRPRLAITIDYGQRPARSEIQAARAVCATLGLEHDIVKVDCSSIGSGDLAGMPALGIAPVSEWWPYRNQLLVTLAAARLVGKGYEVLWLGTVASDAVHVDGTAEFVAALSRLTELQEGHLRVDAPAIRLSSPALVRQSGVTMDVLAWAHSCHVADFACGMCRGCAKHFETMKEIGVGPY